MRIRFWKQIMSAKATLGVTSDELGNPELSGCEELVYYIVFGAGTGAGAIQVESAHQAGYTGTWAPEGSPVAWSAANKVSTLRVQGASFVSRARISTGVTGGTVDVYVMGLG